jgi:hypothetical protein
MVDQEVNLPGKKRKRWLTGRSTFRSCPKGLSKGKMTSASYNTCYKNGGGSGQLTIYLTQVVFDKRENL